MEGFEYVSRQEWIDDGEPSPGMKHLLEGKWPVVGSTGVDSPIYSIEKGRANDVFSASLKFEDTNQFLNTPVFTPNTTWIIGCGLKILPIENQTIFSIQDGNEAQLTLVYNSTTTDMLLYRGDSGGTLLGSSSTNYFTNALAGESNWHYFELKVTINGSTGAATLIGNGTSTEFTLTSINTSATGSTTADNVKFLYEGTTSDYFIDDIYICDDTGSVNNDFLGDVKIRRLLPNSSGSSSDFVANIGSTVDAIKTSPPDDDTTYIRASTIGDVSTFAFGDLPSESNTQVVFAVEPSIYIRKSEPGNRTIKNVLDINGTNYDGSVIYPVLSEYDYATEIYEANPDISGPWLPIDLNDTQFGFEIDS